MCKWRCWTFLTIITRLRDASTSSRRACASSARIVRTRMVTKTWEIPTRTLTFSNCWPPTTPSRWTATPTTTTSNLNNHSPWCQWMLCPNNNNSQSSQWTCHPLSMGSKLLRNKCTQLLIRRWWSILRYRQVMRTCRRKWTEAWYNLYIRTRTDLPCREFHWITTTKTNVFHRALP